MNPTPFLKQKNVETVFGKNPFTKTEERRQQFEEGDMARSISQNELLIEIDIKEGYDTPELRKQLYELQVKNFYKLEQTGFETYLFNHQGKSPHIRIYNFEGLNKENQESYFINFVQKYCLPSPQGTGYDKSFYGSFHWSPIEFQKHFKYGTKYELEKNCNEGNKNVFEPELATEIKKETERKVKISYWEILTNTEAGESERCSAVMQIHNTHPNWTKQEVIDYICKHNKWSDFNPEITIQKINLNWKYTEKPNPVKKEYSFDRAIFSFKDYYEMADKFLEKQPLFYNDKKLWWAWNFEDYCWRLIDEIDILNAINATVHGVKLFESKQRSEILSALQMRSRLKKPLDSPDTWIQFKNKIYDYKTGETFESTPEYFVTNPIPYEIGESEDTPTLDKWFTEWVGEKWKDTLYEIIAYSCVPHYRLNRIFCFNGEGRNGKSTFLHVTRNFVGQKNCCSSSMDTIMSRTFETAKLYKKLVCEMGEINSNIFRKTELIKKLVGSDTIGFEFKGKDGFDGYNYAKILVATNKLPETTDKTTGFYSKWIIVDFNNRFAENANFLDGLPKTEYNCLAKKCLRIIKELMGRGVFTNEGSAEEKELRYEEKSSPFSEFMRQEIELDKAAETPFFQIYDEYVAYCEQRNQRKPSKVEVSRILKSKGFVDSVMRFTLRDGHETTVKSYLGLKLFSVCEDVPKQKDMGLNVYDSV